MNLIKRLQDVKSKINVILNKNILKKKKTFFNFIEVYKLNKR
jgi:hypothetical protein